MNALRTGKRSTQRNGYTLLEMILALSISLLLLFGLYVALDIHLTASKSGRAAIDEAMVFRGVLSKFQTDISQNIAMISNVDTLISTSTNIPSNTTESGYSAVANSSTSTSSTGSTGSTASSTTGSTTSSTTSTTGSTTTGSTSSTSSSSTTPTQTNYMPFNLGVQGTSSYVTIFASRPPYGAANQAAGSMAAEQSLDSDLRRITYWLDANGDQGGIYRQEVGAPYMEAATDLNTLSSSLPPDTGDPSSKLFAKGVIDLSFEYWDGANWNETWDGTVLGPDMVTPLGPPMAIAINMKVARKDVKSASAGDSKTYRSFRYVVQIPTAINYQNYQNSLQYQNQQTIASGATGGN